jgi:hypothetical protein
MYEENFIELLTLRKQQKRKNDEDNNIKIISYNLIHNYTLSQNKELLETLLKSEMKDILIDCEIYPEMNKNKAIDCLYELSNLASIFSIEKENWFYSKIILLISTLISTFNLISF